jgi:exodeoxyribonuclease V alpha subunit
MTERNRPYAMLGMATAWRRFEARGLAGGAQRDFEQCLRQAESAAEQLNLAPESIHLAAEIAAFEPKLDWDDRLALILLVTMSLAALQDGSTRLAIGGDAGRETMRRMLAVLCGDAFGADWPEQCARRIERILAQNLAPHVIAQAPNGYAPLIRVGDFIYQHRMLRAETRLADALRPRLSARPIWSADEEAVVRAFDDLHARPAAIAGRRLILSDEQRAAVVRAATSGFTIITGGPGTGKTSIIVAILRMLARLGVAPEKIAMAAPTGKAAFRMSESVRESLAQLVNPAQSDEALRAAVPEARTIHRLLGYSPSSGRFMHHGNNQLDAAVVIVDECSMLDLVLTERLLAAIPEQTQLVMLGDADQLPSVTAGAVFRDLVDAAENAREGARVCIRLSYSYRMEASDEGARSIPTIASAVNRGSADALAAGGAEGSSIIRRARAADLKFEGVEMLAAPGALEEFLERWHKEFACGSEIERLTAQTYAQTDNGFDEGARASLKRLLELRAASRILCLTRVLPTGAERVNRFLHALGSTGPTPASSRILYRAGEPVMLVRNDYERMLFNGDQGVVVRVRTRTGSETMMVVFDRRDGISVFHLDALRDSIELSYATTVHKAQGSEFDAVALILPEIDLPILSREMLYTGLTRSRRSVAIVGAESILRAGIARRIERHSGLRDLLLAAPTQ